MKAHAAAIKAASEVLMEGLHVAHHDAHHVVDDAKNAIHETVEKMKGALKDTVMEFCDSDLVPVVIE